MSQNKIAEMIYFLLQKKEESPKKCIVDVPLKDPVEISPISTDTEGLKIYTEDDYLNDILEGFTS